MRTKYGVFDWVNSAILLIISLICVYPFLYILAIALSDGRFVSSGDIYIIPKGINIETFRYIFSNERLNVLTGLRNSLAYAFVGTIVSVILTYLTAYALSRKKVRGRYLIMMLFLFTFVFEAGIVPNYIVWSEYGLVNSFWVMIIPLAINTFFLVITRTFLDGLPYELEEAAVIDGANDLRIMWNVFRPLSTPVIATITVFYAVAIWNQFLIPLIYLQDDALHPIQLVLYNLVIQPSGGATTLENLHVNGHLLTSKNLQAAAIVTAMIPILLIYPFTQKYFTKGFLIGSVKG